MVYIKGGGGLLVPSFDASHPNGASAGEGGGAARLRREAGPHGAVEDVRGQRPSGGLAGLCGACGDVGVGVTLPGP